MTKRLYNLFCIVLIHDYNLLRPSEKQKAREILKGLLGHIADDEILIVQPFYCDYGKQISVGKACTHWK